MIWARDTFLALLCLSIIWGAAAGFAELVGRLLT